MSPERWDRCKDVVANLLERERREWPSSLVDACGDDVDVFLEATSLLAVSRSAGDFIRAPAWRMLSSAAGLRQGSPS